MIGASAQRAELAPWVQALLAIPALRLRIPILAGAAPTPGASALRGAMGQQLLARDDDGALGCLFPSASSGASESPWGACPPWALHVDTEQRMIEIGVFADALTHLPALLTALLLSARGRVGECANLRLGPISHEKHVGTGEWIAGLPTHPTGWAMPARPAGMLALRFVTPLRLRKDGKATYASRCQPRDLLANVMRRLTALSLQSGLPAPTWDARALLEPSGLLHWESAQLSWSELARYSQRQQAQMHLGGLVGTATIDSARIGALWPVLWMGQFVHAGKTPTLGMGRYTVSSLNSFPAGEAVHPSCRQHADPSATGTSRRQRDS